MLTGQALGKAIEEAIALKGVNRSEVARHFGVKPESTYDWTKHGRISKKHIERLIAYFSDVVGPAHWGLTGPALASQPVQLDVDKLAALIGAVDVAVTRSRKRVSAHKKAQTVVAVYQDGEAWAAGEVAWQALVAKLLATPETV